MFIRMMFFVGILFFSGAIFAETCPSISAIHTHHYSGWHAYDSEEDILLSAHRVRQFDQAVSQFALAEWKSFSSQKSNVRCYYRDQAGTVLDVYLSPIQSVSSISKNDYWYAVTNAKHCAAGLSVCQFERRPEAAILLTRIH